MLVIYFFENAKIMYGWTFISSKTAKNSWGWGVYFNENAEIKYVSGFIHLKRPK